MFKKLLTIFAIAVMMTATIIPFASATTKVEAAETHNWYVYSSYTGPEQFAYSYYTYEKFYTSNGTLSYTDTYRNDVYQKTTTYYERCSIHGETRSFSSTYTTRTVKTFVSREYNHNWVSTFTQDDVIVDSWEQQNTYFNEDGTPNRTETVLFEEHQVTTHDWEYCTIHGETRNHYYSTYNYTTSRVTNVVYH